MTANVNICRVERRRNHRLRQFIDCAYGLTLCCVAGHAMASSPRAAQIEAELQQSKRIETAARSPRLIFLGLEAWGASSDELNNLLRDPLRAAPGIRQSFLDAVDRISLEDLEFKRHPIKSVKDGLGFDLYLPEGGAVHFNLYQRRNPKREGVRVALNPVDGQTAMDSRHRNWSVGVSTDFVRTIDGDRRVNLKPQLLLDLDGLLKLSRTKIEACIEYGHWYSGSKATADVQVAQAKIRMRF